MKYLIVAAVLSVPVLAGANTISTSPVELNIAAGIEPVCYFEDKRYSRGAVLQMGQRWFVCERETSFEQNGRLSWHPFQPDEAKQQRN
ncbi:DUF1496 domain-containing protein [Oceanimonas baumannii]|uniref:Uncharacterized protein DUF1496 n=1 Tax=Oceanimonas baumannii TaxID=129578 RepID=A0ABY2EX82_9GAMM|nr:DUF1496 domain-containing protein [Oceanimonas baumannii]TDW58395.1 uncharacterized protein DUF1496 [Oceanimonas baumannii]